MNNIEGLDVEAGMSVCGSEEQYKKILSVYHMSIEKRSELIQTYAQDKDLKNFTIEIHGLKSASKAIGAMKLSEMAESLEVCGNNNDIATVRAGVADLINLYKSYITILEPYSIKICKVPGKVISMEELISKLEIISFSLRNFDINTAKNTVDGLRLCEMEEVHTEILDNLTEAIDNFNYEEAIEFVEEWKILVE